VVIDIAEERFSAHGEQSDFGRFPFSCRILIFFFFLRTVHPRRKLPPSLSVRQVVRIVSSGFQTGRNVHPILVRDERVLHNRTITFDGSRLDHHHGQERDRYDKTPCPGFPFRHLRILTWGVDLFFLFFFFFLTLSLL
jgi:hypothetical protein